MRNERDTPKGDSLCLRAAVLGWSRTGIWAISLTFTRTTHVVDGEYVRILRIGSTEDLKFSKSSPHHRCSKTQRQVGQWTHARGHSDWSGVDRSGTGNQSAVITKKLSKMSSTVYWVFCSNHPRCFYWDQWRALEDYSKKRIPSVGNM